MGNLPASQPGNSLLVNEPYQWLLFQGTPAEDGGG